MYTLIPTFFFLLSGPFDLYLKKTMLKETKKEMKNSRIRLHLFWF